jgi:hypothetical protein
MSKITKVQVKEFVKNKLSTDSTWAKHALLEIFKFQTLEEQKVRDTTEYNGVGFTGTDGRILSSLASQLLKKKYLSDKQMLIVFKKMPKYWNQVVKISDKEKLNSMIKL